MNGTITIRHSIGDDFTPSAAVNQHSATIATVTVAEDVTVVLYSAGEARRYAAAFAEAARLLDDAGPQSPACDRGEHGDCIGDLPEEDHSCACGCHEGGRDGAPDPDDEELPHDRLSDAMWGWPRPEDIAAGADPLAIPANRIGGAS